MHKRASLWQRAWVTPSFALQCFHLLAADPTSPSTGAVQRPCARSEQSHLAGEARTLTTLQAMELEKEFAKIARHRLPGLVRLSPSASAAAARKTAEQQATMAEEELQPAAEAAVRQKAAVAA